MTTVQEWEKEWENLSELEKFQQYHHIEIPEKVLQEIREEGAAAERERINNMPAFTALKSYQQADGDGIMVLVSRQAIDEIVDALTPTDDIIPKN